jgi:hypothetical protein
VKSQPWRTHSLYSTIRYLPLSLEDHSAAQQWHY